MSTLPSQTKIVKNSELNGSTLLLVATAVKTRTYNGTLTSNEKTVMPRIPPTRSSYSIFKSKNDISLSFKKVRLLYWNFKYC